MRIRYALPVMFCLVALAGGLGASARADEQPMTADNFLTTASAMNKGEINAAEMALKQDDAAQEIKGLADQLYRDHQRLGEQLEQLAQSRTLSLAATADARSLGNAARLAVLSGANFDQAFLETQVAAHERFIRLMERAAQELEDDELREFARMQVAPLRAHLERAKKLAASRSE